MKPVLLVVCVLLLGTTLSYAGGASDNASEKAAPTDESAKMGKEEGTHAGHQAIKPENDTKKVEQPERKNDTKPQ